MENQNKYNQGRKYGNSEELSIVKQLKKEAINYKQAHNKDLLDDLQANILKHHKKEHVEYHFLKFKSKEKEKAVLFVEEVGKKITTALEHIEDRKKPILSMYLTYSGYTFFDIPPTIIPEDIAFRSSIKERTMLSQEDIVKEYQKEEDFEVIIMYACDKEDLAESLNGLVWKKELEKEYKKLSFIEKKHTEYGHLKNPLKDDDFKFKDGISNPSFFPGTSKREKIISNQVKKSNLSSLDIVLTRDKGGSKEISCGSYGAFAKFKINEDSIDNLVKKIVEKTGMEKELAAANIIGRFKDGTPLTLSGKPKKYPTNNFNYDELIKQKRTKIAQTDEEGLRCPFHTHIRKANPRTEHTKNKAIVRRGVYYGKKEEKDKGILFFSFQNSLSNQFEYVLNHWMLDKYTVTKDEDGIDQLKEDGRDILFCQPGDVYTIPSEWNLSETSTIKKTAITIEAADRMVSFQGGIYFFAPCKSFFNKIFAYNTTLLKRRHKDLLAKKNLQSVPVGYPAFNKETEVKLNAKQLEEKGDIKFNFGTMVSLNQKEEENA